MKKLIIEFEKHNLSVDNIVFRDQVPESILEASDQFFEKYKRFFVDKHKYWKFLNDNMGFDENKENRKRLRDIITRRKSNLVHEIYPELKYDKDGLIKIPQGSNIILAGFEYNGNYLTFCDTLIFYFQLFEFLSEKRNNFEIRVLINPDRLGISETVSDISLLEHWEGPNGKGSLVNKFGLKNEIFYITFGEGETGKKIQDKIVMKFEKKEEKWHLQMEETIPVKGVLFSEVENINGEEFKFYTRYVHAILNKDLSKCFHLDFSMRAYNDFSLYKRRCSLNFEFSSSEMKHKKIMRFDSGEGNIPFKKIIGFYFKFNPYLIEFFDGKTEQFHEIEALRKSTLSYDLKNKGWI